jgi:hypothetical protein
VYQVQGWKVRLFVRAMHEWLHGLQWLHDLVKRGHPALRRRYVRPPLLQLGGTLACEHLPFSAPRPKTVF